MQLGMVKGLINDGLERFWKGTVKSYSRYHADIYLQGLKKITKKLRIAGTLVEFRNKRLSNISVKPAHSVSTNFKAYISVSFGDFC
jgi:hypothetical protein